MNPPSMDERTAREIISRCDEESKQWGEPLDYTGFTYCKGFLDGISQERKRTEKVLSESELPCLLYPKPCGGCKNCEVTKTIRSILYQLRGLKVLTKYSTLIGFGRNKMLDNYDDGYAIGFEEGRHRGYEDGYIDASQDYEHRLAKFWVEMQTLNARISYLEKLVGMEG